MATLTKRLIEQAVAIDARFDAAEARAAALEVRTAPGDKGDILVGDEWTIDPDLLSAFGRTLTAALTAERARHVLAAERSAPYRISPDRTILAPDGSRFIMRGVHMFPSVFVSHEYRHNYLYRVREGTAAGTMTLADGTVVATGAASEISAPTYLAKFVWVSAAFAEQQVDDAWRAGANTILINIEPASRYVPAYRDVITGAVFPSELDMIDGIIEAANRRGMVCIVRSGNDQLSQAQSIEFCAWMGDRWRNNSRVWINPRNEINCFGVRQPDGSIIANANCTLPTVWVADQEAYVTAIRDAGFENLILLNSTSYGGEPNEVEAQFDASSILSNDKRIVFEVHHYKRDADADFKTARRAESEVEWLSHKYCVIAGEVGINNGILAETDTDGAPSDAAEWADQQAYLTDMLRWTCQQIATERVQGYLSYTWGGYNPSTGHNSNSLRLIGTTNGWTTHGALVRDGLLQKRIERLAPAQCHLQRHSATQLKLVPANGDMIPIGQAMYQLPWDATLLAQGVLYAASGLSVSTLYYVYASLSSGLPVLSLSTTGYVIDPYRNIAVKLDSPESTLVGMVYTDAAGEFVDSSTNRLVRSYYNRRSPIGSSSFTVDRTRDSASGDGEVNAEMKIGLAVWADEKLDMGFTGSVTNSAVSGIVTRINYDGTNLKAVTTNPPVAGTQIATAVAATREGPTEGYHTVTINGSANAGTATWKLGGFLKVTVR